MRRLTLLVLSIVFIVSFVVLTAGFSDAGRRGGKTYLKQGWDDFGHPLTKGTIIWNQTPRGLFQVTYVLVGASPNHNYQVGIHLFPTEENDFWQDFGSEGWEDNERSEDGDWICRYDDFPEEGWVEKCSYLNAWEFGFLTTDDNGNGVAHFNLHPNSGTYEIQFTVRIGTCTMDYHDGCAVAFESGGPYTTTETIIIQE
jgi:hypothetical protein